MKKIDTHGLVMDRLLHVVQKSDVLKGQGAYGNHFFQIFYDTRTGRVSYEEHIGDGYAKPGPDEIVVGYVKRKLTQQELADMIYEAVNNREGAC
jgi:hypothetical protein